MLSSRIGKLLALRAAERMLIQVRERHRKDGDPFNTPHPECPGGNHPVLCAAFATWDIAIFMGRAEDEQDRAEGWSAATVKRHKINELARRLAARHANGELL